MTKKVFNFLKKLKKNNRKEWFDAHKDEFLEAKDEFEAFVTKVLAGLRKFDKDIGADLQPKQCIFRIYRDIRFSKDKTPYKTHMSADINPGGRKSGKAGYYFQLSPGHSFVAGGLWMPEPPVLQAIRQEIDYSPEKLLGTLKSPSLRKYFKGLDDEDKMSTAPKGFDKNHPQIDLLRNRHFLVSTTLSDAQMQGPKAVDALLGPMKAMLPLLKYLREAQEDAG
jgi:uncharacterized protein (TIGR02453 family)